MDFDDTYLFIGAKAVVCTDQADSDISTVLHGRFERDPSQVQEHGGQELRVSLITNWCISQKTSLSSKLIRFHVKLEAFFTVAFNDSKYSFVFLSLTVSFLWILWYFCFWWRSDILIYIEKKYCGIEYCYEPFVDIEYAINEIWTKIHNVMNYFHPITKKSMTMSDV